MPSNVQQVPPTQGTAVTDLMFRSEDFELQMNIWEVGGARPTGKCFHGLVYAGADALRPHWHRYTQGVHGLVIGTAQLLLTLLQVYVLDSSHEWSDALQGLRNFLESARKHPALVSGQHCLQLP